jgi:hypothetical protein
MIGLYLWLYSQAPISPCFGATSPTLGIVSHGRGWRVALSQDDAVARTGPDLGRRLWPKARRVCQLSRCNGSAARIVSISNLGCWHPVWQMSSGRLAPSITLTRCVRQCSSAGFGGKLSPTLSAYPSACDLAPRHWIVSRWGALQSLRNLRGSGLPQSG